MIGDITVFNWKKVLFYNRKSDKKAMLLHFGKRKYRSNCNIRQIIGRGSFLYRMVIYHRDISRCLFLKFYGVLIIRRYNYKRRLIEDLIRQCRLKCSLRCYKRC